MLQPASYAALVVAGLSASCANAPTDAEISRASIGPEPDPATCEAYARDYLNHSLKGGPATIAFKRLAKGWYPSWALSSPRFAWLLAASVNARTYWFFFLNGHCCALGIQADVWQGARRDPSMAIAEIGAGSLTAEQAGLR